MFADHPRGKDGRTTNSMEEELQSYHVFLCSCRRQSAPGLGNPSVQEGSTEKHGFKSINSQPCMLQDTKLAGLT